MLYRALHSSALFFIFVFAGCRPTLPQTLPPPADRQVVVGNSDVVVATLGPAGGELRLGSDAAPKLSVPEGALTPAGRDLTMTRKPNVLIDGADLSYLPPVFEITPATDAEPGFYFEVSMPLPTLPEACDGTQLALAVELQNTESKNSESSPQLVWDYLDAESLNGVVKAKLSRIQSHRMVFVCQEAVE